MIYYSIYNILLKSSTTLFSYFFPFFLFGFFFCAVYNVACTYVCRFFFLFVSSLLSLLIIIIVIIHPILGATGARQDGRGPCCGAELLPCRGGAGAAPRMPRWHRWLLDGFLLGFGFFQAIPVTIFWVMGLCKLRSVLPSSSGALGGGFVFCFLVFFPLVWVPLVGMGPKVTP